VGRLELQGDLHQRVRDVGGGFVGDAYTGDWAERLRVIVAARTLLVNLVLHAEALAFDDDGVGVVQDAIEDGGVKVLSLLNIWDSACRRGLVVITIGARS